LGVRTDLQYRTAGAAEVIDIEETGWRTSVTGLPHDKICIDRQIANHLALHSEACVCRGGAGQVSSVKWTLLDVGDGKVAIVRTPASLREIRANGGQNLQRRSTTE
jgi:hypothetical protein